MQKTYPWFTEEIRNIKMRLRWREELWHRYRTVDLWTAYKKVRNQYKFKLNEAKRSVISNKALECKGDTKALHKLLTEITGGKTDNTSPLEKVTLKMLKI